MSAFLDLYLALHRSGPALSDDVISEVRSMGDLLSESTVTPPVILVDSRVRIAQFLGEVKKSLLQLTSTSVEEVSAALHEMGIANDDLRSKLVRSKSDFVWDHVMSKEDDFLGFLLTCGANMVKSDPAHKLYLVHVLSGRSIFDELDEKWNDVSNELPDINVHEAKELVKVVEENSAPLVGGEQGFVRVYSHWKSETETAL